MNSVTQLPPLSTDKPQKLDKLRHWQTSWHVFDQDSINAVNAALASGRPLLLRGEPGCGKSQLARAVAQVLKWPFLSRVVNASFEPEDLLYRYDAIARLSAAQIRDEKKENLHPSKYLLPEILWWAFNSGSAKGQCEQSVDLCGEVGTEFDGKEQLGFDFTPDKGSVVLIDEIDKADTDVPNSLLEVLSLGGFNVPYGLPSVESTGIPPLIIITTNEDRELPPAFVRRCLVHYMGLPDDYEELRAFVKVRVLAHLEDLCLEDEHIDQAIQYLADHRKRMKTMDLPKPGQAELLDLIRAVSRLVGAGQDAEALLEQFHPFVFDKYRSE